MLSAAPASAQIVPRATSVAAAPAAGGENWPSREVVFLDRLFHPLRDGSGERNPEAIPPTQTEIRPYGSILSGLKPGMSPKTVVALQFAEKGRRLLQGGAYQRSLGYFEKALGLGAGPYIYYYLAHAHYRLAHIKESMQFLDVAQGLLKGNSDWMAEVEALRAKFHAVTRESQHNFKPIAWPAR